MSANSAAPASAQPLRHAPRADRAAPADARQLAAQLSALFDRDVEIVKRLNDAHHRLQQASERLWPGLAPDAFGLTNDNTAVAAIGQSPIAALIRDDRHTATSQVLEVSSRHAGRSTAASASTSQPPRSAVSSRSTSASSPNSSPTRSAPQAGARTKRGTPTCTNSPTQQPKTPVPGGEFP
jgi:hypothetical protein